MVTCMCACAIAIIRVLSLIREIFRSFHFVWTCRHAHLWFRYDSTWSRWCRHLRIHTRGTLISYASYSPVWHMVRIIRAPLHDWAYSSLSAFSCTQSRVLLSVRAVPANSRLCSLSRINVNTAHCPLYILSLRCALKNFCTGGAHVCANGARACTAEIRAYLRRGLRLWPQYRLLRLRLRRRYVSSFDLSIRSLIFL